ncbi:MAG: VacB/RNase II family 3'-5' exoribonuclease [Elusimicrobia bacterium]|nr:VacB/RNase II family 3'-5' exoribonuclease [Elusimicrobiota bacterium]
MMKHHWKRQQRRPAPGQRAAGGAGGGENPRRARGAVPSGKPPEKAPPPDARRETVLDGVIQHHGRFAFLLAETEGGSDVFLRGRGLNLAMDGDRVQARVRREADGRFSGELLRVLKRVRASVVGILKHSPRGWAVCPEKAGAPPAQVAGFAPAVKPEEGAFAVLKVTRWPTENAPAAGTVTEVLGSSDDVRVRITALLRARGFGEYFPKEALAQSSAFGDRLHPSQWKGREELFRLPIVTIDGADAKDFDDAVSLEPLGGGLVRLGVHIADVEHYVKAGSALDKEAYSRATSVYLPDRVAPMLPPSLSDNLCSLVPLAPRLTVSVFMDINSSGKVTRRRMAVTVIRSCRRFTYEEVQALLDGGSVPAVPKAAAEAVTRMGALAKVLYKRRVDRGALDFNLPEYKVVTGADGRPLRVTLRPRLWSHRLIEEFMLLANEAIATELMAAKRPFLHRRHDVPDPAKMKTLAKTLVALGLPAGGLLGSDPHKGLQDALTRAGSHPLADIINSLIVRSMRQAVYSPESLGHFGIAARAYAHFTSPIRRYPDLTAHRAVKALLLGKKEEHTALSLAAAGTHCSERERAAADAEHKALDLLRAELFKGRIGEMLDGSVATVIDSGAFVLLGDTGAEGLLRVTNLKPGAKVRVIVEAVDAVKGKIYLSLVQQARMSAQWRVIPFKRKK